MRKLIVVLVCVAALFVAVGMWAVPAEAGTARSLALKQAFASQGVAFDLYVECYNIVHVGDVWETPGAEGYDVHDGPITLNVDYPDGPVDTSAPGVFREIWSGADAAGNEAIPKLRVVIVEEVPDTDPPVISLIGCAE